MIQGQIYQTQMRLLMDYLGILTIALELDIHVKCVVPTNWQYKGKKIHRLNIQSSNIASLKVNWATTGLYKTL